jgi:23S rRNA (guanosine2251-2'-O)-methyltransferase
MKGKNRSSRWPGGSQGRDKPHSGDRSRGPASRGASPRSEAPRQREHARNPAPAAQLKTHVPARSKSGIWLYGIHPVLAAAANPRRRTIRVIVTPEHEATIGARLAVLAQSHPLGLPPAEILARDGLERLLPRGAVHQGVAALVDTLDDADIEDICRATDGQHDARVVVLDQVTDPHNVGAVIRSAAAFGCAAVIVQDRHAPPATGTMAKAASGALERVPLVQVVNIARALDRLKQAGFWSVGLDTGATQAISEADLTGKVALVLGSEGEGLRRLTRERCDVMVRIPIAKGIESLNISNAAAVALYELARRS